MSYHEYRKMMGQDVSKAEAVPRYDFEAKAEGGWDLARFDGYGTLYHDESRRGIRIDWYYWAGSDDVNAIKEHLTAAGFQVAHLDRIYGGNGHYSLVEEGPRVIQ